MKKIDPKRINSLYRALPDDRFVRYEEIQKLCDVNLPGIKAVLRNLKNLGLVTKIGTPGHKNWPMFKRTGPKEATPGEALLAVSASNTSFEDKRKIYDLVKNAVEAANGEWITVPKIFDRVDASESQITSALLQLKKKGLVASKYRNGYRWIGQKENMRKAFEALDNVLTKQEQDRIRFQNQDENFTNLKKHNEEERAKALASPVGHAHVISGFEYAPCMACGAHKELPRPYNYKFSYRSPSGEVLMAQLSVTLPCTRLDKVGDGPYHSLEVTDWNGAVVFDGLATGVEVDWHDGARARTTSFGSMAHFNEPQEKKEKGGFWSRLFGTK